MALFSGKPLVIASHNTGKVREIGELIEPLGIKVMSATQADIDEPEETGDTFIANAILKSENACTISNLPSLADDSGLVIPAIGDAPGIYSARWAGPNKDFNVAIKRIESELGNKPTEAYFVCVLALSIPNTKTIAFEGRVHGHITLPPRGNKGFGYDPIFIANGHTQTFGEIDPNLKNSISHRAAAFSQFLTHLKSLS